ncbi:type II secretion system protein GspG [Candidatus Roizmanbacteria bacterium]|nr:type II secretion system protein GspG [Candidatus Roizmanbacteria bacterium]
MKKSFTLIEIIVVITIIGILAALITANFFISLKRSRDSKRKSDLYNITTALELYYTDNGYYPLVTEYYSSDQLCSPSSCSEKVYMKKIPTDPLTHESYYYETDESGSYFRIYSSIENNQDQGDNVNQSGYNAVCSPNPCKYGLASTNVGLVTLVESNSNLASGQLRKVSTPTPSLSTDSTVPPLPNSNSLPVFNDYNEALKDNLDVFQMKVTRESQPLSPYYSIKYVSWNCPNGYGIRDLKCQITDMPTSQVNLTMVDPFNQGHHSYENLSNDYARGHVMCTYYPYDQSANSKSFHVDMTFVCDKKYVLPLWMEYNSSEFNSMKNKLPDMFILYLVDKLTNTVNSQQQSQTVICPEGYKADNISCNSLNYDSHYDKNLRLISNSTDSDKTATCLYEADQPLHATISTYCIKK